MNNKLQISNRGINMPASPIRKLAPYAYSAEDRGVKIYRLNIGQPDIPTPKKAIDAIRNIDRTTLEYSPSQGYKSLRQALVRYYTRYGINLTPDDIIITSGGSEAVLFAFLSCLNPGDEIIVPEPAYANYMSLAISAGAVIRGIPTSIDKGFALPEIKEFEKLISSRTKAILICNPNNPTGYLYSQKEMNHIRDLVKKHNLFLFSDEVYREFIYADSPYVSALQLEGIEDNVILIDSVSKRYSECGIRIGALVTRNERVRNTVMKFCQARLSPPLIGQIAAEASIDGTEDYSREVYNEYVKRRECLIEGINRIPGCYSPLPMGAFYTIAGLPVDDAEKFCLWCLKDFCYKDERTPEGTTGETIMMAPASGFYSVPELGRNQVRLAYVLNTHDLNRALFILEKALEAYNNNISHLNVSGMYNPNSFTFRAIRRLINMTNSFLPDETYLKLKFRHCCGYRLNLDNPQTFNEKIQWLKLNDIHKEYTRLVDKIDVKSYVAETAGAQYVIPTLGTWNTVDEVDWASLPDSFVIKCTNDSGGVVVCKDKAKLDIDKSRKKLKKRWGKNYYNVTKEYPYRNVKPRVLAEEYLEDESGELKDYKFFCFNGEPKFLFVATGRQQHDTRFDFYDLDWNHLPIKNGHPNASTPPLRPENFEEMVEVARKLSKGMPHVRVDLYNIRGKIYFGEMTFFHFGGMARFEPKEWDYKFGAMLELPISKDVCAHK